MATDDGGTTQWSSASALETQDRQAAFWQAAMRYRYVSVFALALLVLPSAAGQNHLVVAAILLFGVQPYNVAFDWWFRRTKRQPLLLPFTDELWGGLVILIAPQLLPETLLVLVAVTATAAVAQGRRIALLATVFGAAVAAAAALAHEPQAETFVLIGVFAVASGFLASIVGGISEVEQDVRGRYGELMSGIDAIVWEQLSRRPSTLYVNRRAEEILGYPVAAWRQPGFWRAHVHPDDVERAARAYREATRKGQHLELGYRMIADDGRIFHMHDRMRVETDSYGQAVHVRGVMLDVTAEREAAEQADQYVNLVESIHLALFVFGLRELNDDDTLELLALNPEAAAVTDLDTEQATGHAASEVLPFADLDAVIERLADVARTSDAFVIEDFRPDPNRPGARVYSVYAFPLPNNRVGLSLHDITERAMAAEVLRRQALHDALTGLPNRTLLNERLREALKHSKRSGEDVALLVMDLDQFKEVNDALGHDHGDRLLIEISRRLQHVLRDADTIARLGGDEFAVLLTTSGNAEGAETAARRIREALEQPFQLGGITLQTNGSIGIAVHPLHAEDAESLAQKADVAMYTAKRGAHGIALYAPEHDQSSVRRLALLGELRRAISDDELVLHFQPTLNLHTREVDGAEALVRWLHPDHGLMAPSEFIELAELSGMIQPLTRWVIEHALRQVRDWRDAGIVQRVAVNLSVRNLYERELVPWLDRQLIEHGIDASLLKLEITESELMDDPMLALEVLGKMKSLGISTSIDDFGTGYSSLSYLKNLPIDELKIDRSFVGTMVDNDSDLTIVRSTIDLSHNLGLDVVAEGVEDGPTLGLLHDMGCDRAQGYFISRPVPASDLTAWLQDPAAQRHVHETLSRRP